MRFGPRNTLIPGVCMVVVAFHVAYLVGAVLAAIAVFVLQAPQPEAMATHQEEGDPEPAFSEVS